MAQGIRDLKVWQEAVALGGDVARVVRRHSARETRGLGEQLLRDGLGLAGAVADGSLCPAPADQRQHFRAARRRLLALETHLAIARHADLVPAAAAAQLGARATALGRLLAGYLSYLDRQVEEERRVLGSVLAPHVPGLGTVAAPAPPVGGTGAEGPGARAD
jgi:four helix bundle protein